jgi:hypothetical protein
MNLKIKELWQLFLLNILVKFFIVTNTMWRCLKCSQTVFGLSRKMPEIPKKILTTEKCGMLHTLCRYCQVRLGQATNLRYNREIRLDILGNVV